MLSLRLTNCRDCAQISKLLESINCQVAKMANNLYLNISYMLDRPVEACTISTLLHYKRILTYRGCNADWASGYSVEDIASRVNFLTTNCKCCDASANVVIPYTTTTTTTLAPPITTTTTTTLLITTTTTTTEELGCDTQTFSGGEGVTEYTLNLEDTGGVITLESDAYSIVDKVEIIHNGVKKATTGMTVANQGPFDNLYGDPTVPTRPEAGLIDQFIGSSKGVIPGRDAEYFAETGLTVGAADQQLIWWKYLSTDYNANSTVVIRITGPDGTAWRLHRHCPEN